MTHDPRRTRLGLRTTRNPSVLADIGRRRRHSLHIGDKRAGLAAAAIRHGPAAECYRRGICLVALNGTSQPNKPKA